MDRMEVSGNTLVVNMPFDFDERQGDEEAFLGQVDRLMSVSRRPVVIDLLRAGGLSSTVIALCIPATRKAEEAGRTLTIRIARRNAIAIRVSGLDKLVAVELV